MAKQWYKPYIILKIIIFGWLNAPQHYQRYKIHINDIQIHHNFTKSTQSRRRKDIPVRKITKSISVFDNPISSKEITSYVNITQHNIYFSSLWIDVCNMEYISSIWWLKLCMTVAKSINLGEVPSCNEILPFIHQEKLISSVQLMTHCFSKLIKLSIDNYCFSSHKISLNFSFQIELNWKIINWKNI